MSESGNEIGQDPSLPQSLFLVFPLFPKDQQTAVPGGASSPSEAAWKPLTCSGRTGLSLEQGGGGEEGREKIMNGQIHHDL